MGWGSGCYVMDGIIDCALVHIPNNTKRRKFYIDVMKVLEEQDWDTQQDCGDKDRKVYEAACKELHPNWYEDEE